MNYNIFNQYTIDSLEPASKYFCNNNHEPVPVNIDMQLIQSIENMPMDQYRDFMSAIDPDVQRQLTFQLTKEKPEYLQLKPLKDS